MRILIRTLSIIAVFAFVAVLFGCKSQEELDYIKEGQLAAKTTQEIVIKQETARETHVINVTGTGNVTVDPDVATVCLTAYAEADAADGAKTLNNELTARVLAAVKQKGITDDDIKTQEITVVPKQEAARNEVTGYSASNTISLRIRNVKRVGEIIDAAVQAGASVVLPLEFYLMDETAAYQEALSAAVADVYAKAKIMADAAGLTIEGPLFVREEYDQGDNSPNVLLYEGTVPHVREQKEGEAEEETAATPVQAGQINVRAQVTAEFSVKWP